MKRYYNENPQVELWKEQARRNQELMIDYKNSRDFYKTIAGFAQKELRELESEVKRFNALPWYKKMFFKFKL